MNFKERLIEKIKQKRSVVCVGIDPDIYTSQFPKFLLKKPRIKLEFAKMIIDSVADLVPIMKLNTRFYLPEEHDILDEIVKYAHKHDLEVIGDCKENDIGDTMAMAYKNQFSFGFDAITVNGYFGRDGVIGNEKQPIFKDWYEKGKGLFVLIKTSNESSGDIQDLTVNMIMELPTTNHPMKKKKLFVYEIMATRVEEWGKQYDHVIGGVVGATHPEQLKNIRPLMNGILLIPGYGAQGGTADAIAHGVGDGKYCIVNSSRGVMYAHDRRFKGQFTPEQFADASRKEVEFMNDDINKHVGSYY